MELYQKMYLTLFAATEDVLNMLDAAPLSFQEVALPGSRQDLCAKLFAGSG